VGRKNCHAAFQKCKKSDGNFITVKIGKVAIEVLIDSRSGHSLMSKGVAKAFRLPIKPIKNPEQLQLLGATGTKIVLLGETDLDMYIQGLRVTQCVKIAQELQPRFLLGTDFLTKNVGAVYFKSRVLSLFDDVIHVNMHSYCDDANCVTLSKRTCVQPFSEMLL